MKKAFAFIAAGVSFISHGASAQNVPTPLYILVETPNATAVACGISKASMIAAIRAALRYNRVEETAMMFRNTIVYVNALAATDCTTFMHLEIYNMGFNDPLPGVGTLTSSRVFCSKGDLLVGGRMSERAQETIKNQFDGCLSDIADRQK